MGGQNPHNTVNLREQIYAPNGGYYVFILQHLRNRKHVPCFYWVIETWVGVWENEKCCGNTSCRRVFPQLFWVLPNFHKCFYLTNRFHVAVHLSFNRSQMTSKCGKNKKVAHEATAECVTDVLTTFWRHLWSTTGQMHGNMESICFI